MTTANQNETPTIKKIYTKKGAQSREVVEIADNRVRYHTVIFEGAIPTARSFESTDVSLKGWARWWRGADRTHKTVVDSPFWSGDN